jgi:hypothetical protein
MRPADRESEPAPIPAEPEGASAHATEPIEPAPLADDEEPPSVETLNPIKALTAAEHDAHIPGVDVAALPGPDDFVQIPGVDGGDFPVPDPVETTVLDAIAEPPVIAAEAVASAPVSEVQPAVTNEARRSTEIPTHRQQERQR